MVLHSRPPILKEGPYYLPADLLNHLPLFHLSASSPGPWKGCIHSDLLVTPDLLMAPWVIAIIIYPHWKVIGLESYNLTPNCQARYSEMYSCHKRLLAVSFQIPPVHRSCTDPREVSVKYPTSILQPLPN